MASDDRNWRDYKYTGTDDGPVDLRKPNHFYHDILGCPFECGGDHNHPTPPKEVKT